MNPLEKKERIQAVFDAVASPYDGKRFFRISKKKKRKKEK